MTSYIRTFNNKEIDFHSPDPGQILIQDIAHALSHTPRFSGHTERFYSVASHSIMVASMVPPPYQLQALLHDATEAYLTDMPTPFKRLLPDYQALEQRVWWAICAKFDIPIELHETVKFADRACLMKEADVLKPGRGSFGDEYENHVRASGIRESEVGVKEYFLLLFGKYLLEREGRKSGATITGSGI